MPFGFGTKKHQHRSPELPVNGHPVNNNLSQLNEILSSNHSSDSPDNSRTNKQIHNIVFKCQLANGSPTVPVCGFSNMRELYDKIAESFKNKGININASEILYCTLNTPKIDMDRLLGGQIGLDDFIFCHRKGQVKEIEINKTEEFLGLTITDNGNGYAFVKKVKEGSIADQIKFIQAGDHIEKVNNTNLVGCRHYEVAKYLKDIPIGSSFIIRMVEPLRDGYGNIAPYISSKRPMSAQYGTGRETLRISAKGHAIIQQAHTEVIQIAIAKINSLLESFMGINDNELANQIWDIGKSCNNPHNFIISINNSDMGEFGFSDDFVFDLWGAISDAKQGRLNQMLNKGD